MKIKTNTLERKKPVRIISWIIIIVFLSLTLFFGRNSFLKVFIKKTDVSKQEQTVNKLKAENDSLRKEIHELKTNPEVIEKIAREKLGYQKSDEKVFRFISTPEDDNITKTKDKNGTNR